MTEIAFHFGAPDKLAYACRLLRKALASGAKVVVLAPEAVTAKLDADLWALSATEFVAHAVGTSEPSVKNRSSVVLVSDMAQAFSERQVLVNLTDSVPRQFDAFARLIEVVSLDEADRHSARVRWKQYTERGYSITRHDLALRGANG